MILREMPRWAGLLFIAVVAFIAGVVVAPLTLIPAAFEETGVFEDYIEYLNGIVTLSWADELDEGGFWVVVGLIAAWAATQALFLSPIVGPPRLEEQGRSMLPSVIVAATIGALGCALLWVAMVEGICAFVCRDAQEFNSIYGLIIGTAYLTGLGVWIAGGFLWFRLLARAGSLRNPAGLDRLVRRLFAGTCVELVLGVVFALGLASLGAGLWGGLVLGGALGVVPAVLVPLWLGRRLGGHSGDSYGACVEWSEALALLLMGLLLRAAG